MMWAYYNHKVLLRGRKKDQWEKERQEWRNGHSETTLLGLQMKEGATNQGMLEASRCGKGKEWSVP